MIVSVLILLSGSRNRAVKSRQHNKICHSKTENISKLTDTQIKQRISRNKKNQDNRAPQIFKNPSTNELKDIGISKIQHENSVF